VKVYTASIGMLQEFPRPCSLLYQQNLSETSLLWIEEIPWRRPPSREDKGRCHNWKVRALHHQFALWRHDQEPVVARLH